MPDGARMKPGPGEEKGEGDGATSLSCTLGREVEVVFRREKQ